MNKKQLNLIIKGFSFIKEYFNTSPSKAPHLPLQVRSEAFDVPIKSQTYDSENEILTIEFERPLTAMSHFIFISKMDEKRLGYVIKSITLPDTLVDALDKCSSDKKESIDYTCPLIEGKHAIESTFWAPEGKVVFWSSNNKIALVLAQSTGITTLPDFFSFIHEEKKIVIPEGVVALGEHCFEGKEYLIEVKLPKSLKRLPKYAFSSCRWLNKINLSHIEEIGEFAFSESCFNKVKLGKKLRFIGEGAFTERIRLGDIKFEGNEQFVLNEYGLICGDVFILCSTNHEPYEIPEGISRLGVRSCCQSSVEKFPSTLKEIGDYAFYKHYRTSEVEFPESLEKIGIALFKVNRNIETVTIPSKIKVIPEFTFYLCERLRKVRIMGANVETLHHSFVNSKFEPDNSLLKQNFQTLEIHSVIPPELICHKMYESEMDLLTIAEIIVPQQSVELYKQAPGWDKYAENIKAGDF